MVVTNQPMAGWLGPHEIAKRPIAEWLGEEAELLLHTPPRI